ncbi:MAG: hypothetical protein RQ741_05360 [Wenzhouxiangellaceae bacterium]|nr:hypothetical protein [Wenzhouxiangellaceae bacterium]
MPARKMFQLLSPSAFGADRTGLRIPRLLERAQFVQSSDWVNFGASVRKCSGPDKEIIRMKAIVLFSVTLLAACSPSDHVLTTQQRQALELCTAAVDAALVDAIKDVVIANSGAFDERAKSEIGKLDYWQVAAGVEPRDLQQDLFSCIDSVYPPDPGH